MYSMYFLIDCNSQAAVRYITIYCTPYIYVISQYTLCIKPVWSFPFLMSNDVIVSRTINAWSYLINLCLITNVSIMKHTKCIFSSRKLPVISISNSVYTSNKILLRRDRADFPPLIVTIVFKNRCPFQ